jgi:hypothetical protein
MMNIYIQEMITGGKTFPCKTFLVRVINQLYIRNVKESLAEPTRRFPHTNVSLSAPVTCNMVEQTLSTQLYSARLTRQEKRKDSKDYARFSSLWVYCIYKKHY